MQNSGEKQLRLSCSQLLAFSPRLRLAVSPRLPANGFAHRRGERVVLQCILPSA